MKLRTIHWKPTATRQDKDECEYWLILHNTFVIPVRTGGGMSVETKRCNLWYAWGEDFPPRSTTEALA